MDGFAEPRVPGDVGSVDFEVASDWPCSPPWGDAWDDAADPLAGSPPCGGPPGGPAPAPPSPPGGPGVGCRAARSSRSATEGMRWLPMSSSTRSISAQCSNCSGRICGLRVAWRIKSPPMCDNCFSCRALACSRAA
ncbi:MAG: hypothetical protein D6753_09120 [Planctomycetota bacterium]|nr:MAG: hypothetical protein D6753_09120 [Planctomycetota bacterium]